MDDVASHKAFSEQHSLPFPILADSDKSVTTAYGTLKEYVGIAKMARRDTFIIDPQGRIAKHYQDVKPAGHSEIVLADLKQLVAQAGEEDLSRFEGSDSYVATEDLMMAVNAAVTLERRC